MSVYVPGSWETGLTIRRTASKDSVEWQLLVGRNVLAEATGSTEDDDVEMVKKLLRQVLDV